MSLVAAAVVASPPAIAQDDGPLVERAQGADRFATAAAISARTFDPADVDTVYLSTGLDFADALAAGTSAALLGGPVLLTLPDFVPPPISAEIDRLGPERVVLVGGTNAIGPEVAAALSGYNVERIGGVDRFETAANLALDAFDPDDVDVVFLATGGGFADALAGVPAAHLRGAPLLLAIDNFLPPPTAAAIDALDPSEVVVLGGFQAIGGEVVNDLQERGLQVNRISGQDRFATADRVARENFPGVREIFVASGLGFADALAGGAAVAHGQGALLLSTDDLLLPGTASVIADLNPRRVTVLGGQNAVAESVLEQIREALAGSTALPDGAIPDLLVSGSPTQNHQQSLYAATLEGDFELLAPTPPGKADLAANWSEDGRRVSFQRINQSGTGLPTDAVPHVMDFVAGHSTLRPLSSDGFCEEEDGNFAAPTWRTNVANHADRDDALILECRFGDFFMPDSSEIRIQPLVGPATTVVPPAGSTYLTARWAPDGRLSVVARDAGGDLGVYLLEDSDWAGGAGAFITDEIDALDLRWVDAQGGSLLLHSDTQDDGGGTDQQVLLGTIDGATGTLWEGPLEGTTSDWIINDVDGDRGVILASDGQRSTDVAVLVSLTGDDVEVLHGPDDYMQSRANSVRARFLADSSQVVVTESRFVRETGGGFFAIDDGAIRVLDIDTGATERLLGNFAFVIADAVNPEGSG